MEQLSSLVQAEIDRQTGGQPVWPRWARVFKRAVDLIGAAVALVISLPLFPIIAVAIKVESPGPVFFRQLRLGRYGRPFVILKFRTMRHGADAEKQNLAGVNQYADPRFFKVRHDPRITRVGSFLRRASLDELPQLLNVLKGDMSLVGPRPPVPEEVEHYRNEEFLRLAVKPGLTGQWQVSGRNNVQSFAEVVRLDISYIRGWSPKTDFLLLLRTVPAVLRGHGAM